MTPDEPSRSRKRTGQLLTIVAVIALGAYGFYQLDEPVEQLSAQSHTSVGLAPLTTADSVVDLSGSRHAMRSTDSATLLVLLDAHCGVCRLHAREYVDLARWSTTQHIAARLILSDQRKTAAQFGRLAGDESMIMLAPSELFVDRFRVLSTPSVVLLDRAGVIRGRWLGAVPRHLEVLNILGRIKV